MSSKLAQRIGLFVGLSLSALAPLRAQCGIDESGSPQPHLSGSAFCSTSWDPDGAGPLPQRLVVGGLGLLGGAQLLGGSLPSLHCVMTWDGSDWTPLGTIANDPSDSVSALLSWNGELIAGGNFSRPGGPNYVARWDGTTWQPLGGGVNSGINSLATWNGNLIAAGYILAGTITIAVVRMWDGVNWTTLPSPPTLRAPAAMVSFEGELIVAGSSALASTQGVLERWNGTTWAPSILAQGQLRDVAVRTSLAVGGSDTLLVAGSFTSIGGTTIGHIAKTNGAPSFAWGSVGGGLPNNCYSVLVRNSGLTDYTVVCETSNPTTPVMRYATSSGTWTALGSTGFNAITYYAGSYHGVNSLVGGTACHRYDGSDWVPVRGPGIAGEVRAATRSGNDMVLGGTFAKVSGVAMNGITRWDGSAFTPLGTGMVGSSVDALVTLDNGDIVAGGTFVAAGGTLVNNIARWNGTTWLPMGSGFDAPVYALCKMPNGDLIAGGAFTQEVGAPVLCSHVARWNGSSWSPMDYGMNNDVLALVVGSDGTLFAGGRFTQTQTTMFSLYYVARWTGTQWAGVGTAMNAPVHGLAARPNGDIIAVGEFTQASLLPVDRIARWNGSTWASMGASSGNAGAVRAVHALPNGDVLAGRGFHQPSSTTDSGISRWNGSTWNSFIFLSSYTTSSPVQVRTIVQRADGDVVLGGSFHTAGFKMAYALASLESTCMPTAAPFGTGCSSTAGPLVTTADSLPWLGATFRTSTTGIAANSLCLGVVGFTQLAMPLNSLLAEGQPGCSLLTSLDFTMLILPFLGVARSEFAVPLNTSLLGVTFHQQILPLEFDLAGALVAIRGANAITATIGTL